MEANGIFFSFLNSDREVYGLILCIYIGVIRWWNLPPLLWNCLPADSIQNIHKPTAHTDRQGQFNRMSEGKCFSDFLLFESSARKINMYSCSSSSSPILYIYIRRDAIGNDDEAMNLYAIGVNTPHIFRTGPIIRVMMNKFKSYTALLCRVWWIGPILIKLKLSDSFQIEQE